MIVINVSSLFDEVNLMLRQKHTCNRYHYIEQF